MQNISKHRMSYFYKCNSYSATDRALIGPECDERCKELAVHSSTEDAATTLICFSCPPQLRRVSRLRRRRRGVSAPFQLQLLYNTPTVTRSHPFSQPAGQAGRLLWTTAVASLSLPQQ